MRGERWSDRRQKILHDAREGDDGVIIFREDAPVPHRAERLTAFLAAALSERQLSEIGSAVEERVRRWDPSTNPDLVER